MKKALISLCLLLWCAAFGAQLFILRHNCGAPRIELFFKDQVAAQTAAATLVDYEPQCANGTVTVFSQKLFIGRELQSLLSQADYTAADQTQVRRLSFQARDLSLAGLACAAVAAAATLTVRDVRRYVGKYRETLRTKYPRQILGDHAEKIVLCAVKWTLLLFIVAYLLYYLWSLRFFVPPEQLPPQYILDLRFYAGVSASLSSPLSAFDAAAGRQLTVMYALSVACLVFALLGTVFTLTRRGVRSAKHASDGALPEKASVK